MDQVWTVTAGNKFYWQTLCVTAETREDAADKFDAYLAAPENQKAEQEELEIYQREVESLSDDGIEYTMYDRRDYNYKFEMDDIEEPCALATRWRGTPSETVQLIDSGGNG